ncbi:MAG: rhodanese-like domain-containing protein [Verrucomicrobiota bacterium]
MRRPMFFAVVAMLGIGVATTAITQAQGIRWTIVNWKVRRDFPDVRRISPNELAGWLADKNRARPVLLDVRTRPEFEVSHLSGARRIDPAAAAGAIDLAKDAPIVTYCSVGYRSGGFAKKLQEAGYTNVQNMSGSIFAWANEGRPLERDGKRVEKVHPYNATWGQLLKPELRADVPAVGSGM